MYIELTRTRFVKKVKKNIYLRTRADAIKSSIFPRKTNQSRIHCKKKQSRVLLGHFHWSYLSCDFQKKNQSLILLGHFHWRDISGLAVVVFLQPPNKIFPVARHHLSLFAHTPLHPLRRPLQYRRSLQHLHRCC